MIRGAIICTDSQKSPLRIELEFNSQLSPVATAEQRAKVVVDDLCEWCDAKVPLTTSLVKHLAFYCVLAPDELVVESLVKLARSRRAR